MSFPPAPSSSNSTSTAGEDSLWLKLLHHSSTRATSPEASCIVVGDNGIIMGILGQNPKLQDINQDSSTLDIICYDCMDIEDSVSESGTKVHLWRFDEKIFFNAIDCLPPVKTASGFHKLLYIIPVDLTKGETDIINFVRHWLRLISVQIFNYYGNLSPEELRALQQYFINYLVTVRHCKSNILGDLVNVNDDDMFSPLTTKLDLAKNRFFVPIVIVGCGCDALNLNDVATMRQIKEVQGKLRLLCLEVGAALMFFSKDIDSQRFPLLKNYLLHRLFNDIRMDLVLNEKIEQTFIPSGFDTNDLINISTGQKQWNEEEFRSFLASPIEQEPILMDTQTGTSLVEVEPEEEWLHGLQNFISTISATGDSAKTVANLSDVFSEVDLDSNKGKSQINTKVAGSVVNASTSATTTNRRASIRTAAPLIGGEKKDVKDFFQNLLTNPNPKK